MFVTYTGSNELLVTTKKREQKMLKEWFHRGNRDLEDYERRLHPKDGTAIQISAVFALRD